MVNSDFPPEKCVRDEQQPVDRISQPSNDILVCILSFVPVLYAARTSVLSKRWIGLWMYITRLDFDAAKMWKIEGIHYMSKRLKMSTSTRGEYIEWANKTLLSHKASRDLDFVVLRIRFDLDDSSKDDTDKWLQYALTRRVQRLELNLCTFRGRKSCAFPPPDLLLSLSDENSSASSPSGSRVSSINSDTIFGFKSFRDLRFNGVAVSGSVLEFFLHSCPFLEHLEVVNSESLEKLLVCGPSLMLEVAYCCKLSPLTVCDTNVVSLKVNDGKYLMLENAPKLVDVYIGIPRCVGNLVETAISKLSCCLSKLEVLTSEGQLRA